MNALTQLGATLSSLSVLDFVFGYQEAIGGIKNAGKTFVKGFLFAMLSVMISLIVFKTHASFLMVLFASFFAIPFVYSRLRSEEHLLLESKRELPLLKHHMQLFMMFLMLFLGIGAAFTTWFLFSPEDVHEPLFSVQSSVLNDINLVSGKIVQPDYFMIILTHNFRVFLVALVLSFIFGYGALFVLTWNAALVSVAVGTKFFSLADTGMSWVMQGKILAISGAGFLLHGIPEFTAYIIAGVMGSIVSIALVNKELNLQVWGKIGKDSIFLFAIAGALLVMAALIEVHISPLLL